MLGFMQSISIISRCGALYRGQKLEGTGITGWQCPYMLAIAGEPGITQEALAQTLHVNKSNVARQMALMEENGLVERRTREEDRRVLEVYPTEKFHALLPAVREAMREWSHQLTSGLTAEEDAQLRVLLERMALRAEDSVKEARQ